MAAAGKKQKKLKGKTLNLTEFLADEQHGLPGGPGSSIVCPKNIDWAAEMENQELDDPDSELPYKPFIDRSMLPTAPRAARGPDIDLELVTKIPPFLAYIGNLPYDVEEEKIRKFFGKLTIKSIRLPVDKGRLRGFGYVEFEERSALIEALSQNEDMIQGRKIRVALPGSQDRDDRRQQDDRPDRTDCDWRRREPGSESGRDDWNGDRGFNDRYGDRGGDRYGDRRFGSRDGYNDRNFGGDSDRDHWRSSSNERGFEEQSFRNDDRGFRDTRWNRIEDDGYRDDRRTRYDDQGFRDRSQRNEDNRGDYNDDGNRRIDRDGGFDRDDRGYRNQDIGFRNQDRGYRSYRSGRDSGFGGRREFGSGYRRDDRGPDYRFGRNENSERFQSREQNRDGSSEPPKERPRLRLQPRSSKPVESTPAQISSIFGGAKPVDTAHREREIEEKILKKKEEEHRHLEEEKENQNYERKSDWAYGSNSQYRSDTEWSQEPSSGGSSNRRERRLSSNSSLGKGIKPAPLSQGRTRRDSEVSNQSDVFSDDKEEKQQPTSRKEEPPPKLIPAPPPKENIWERRKIEQMAAQRSSSQSEQSDSSTPPGKNDRHTSPQDSNADTAVQNSWGKNRASDQEVKQSVVKGQKVDRGRGNSRGRGSLVEPGKKRGGPGGPVGRRGRGREGPDRDRQAPKSIDEMPKYQEAPQKDWSDANKFSYLVDEDADESKS